MKITTKLKFAAWVPLLVALVISLSLFLSYNEIEDAREKSKKTQQIINSMNELNNFAHHYLIYHEERPKVQFLQEHDSISALINTIKFRNREHQELLGNIRNGVELMREVFLKLVSSYNRDGLEGYTELILISEAEERLTGRILILSSEVLSWALHLEGLLDQEISKKQRKINTFIFFLIIVTTSLVTMLLIRMTGTITSSIARVREGTEIVAAGNLNHRIGLGSQDEIGKLSEAFDLMTERLQETTVSRDELRLEIEERKRVEEELRQNREWFRVTLGSIGDAVMATDNSGLITFLNPVAEALTGWRCEEVLGHPVQNVLRTIDEETLAPAEDIVKRVLDEGCIVHMANHTALINREGHQIPIEDSAAPIKDLSGKTIGVVVVFHDVAEKRKAQEALRKSENNLRIVSDFTYDWEYWRSPEGHFLYVSPSCERITGYSREEFIRDPALYGRIVHPEDRERILEHLREDHHQENCELEFRIFHRDGHELWMGHVCRPVLDAKGQSLGRRATDRDITARKLAEEALQKSRDELELRVRDRTIELNEKNRALEGEITERKRAEEDLKAYSRRLELINGELQEFTFVASHDLQEPLRKIQIFGDMLLKGSQLNLDGQSRDYLTRLSNAARRMSELLDSLLRYSRVSTRQDPFEHVALSGVVQEAVSDLELAIEKAGGSLEIGDLPTAFIDKVQIRQLLENLFSNALKYKKESQNPLIRVYGETDDSFSTIYVEDDGIGFEEQFVDRIFKPFQRLHGKNEYGGGTGMGLAICRKIVERHGGRIMARSTPGKGSTFIVQLPANQR